ncbi:YcnI family protein [Pengzhenrongella phosphoraccumulans]|uniref:YcnI family copper-binding membrane protein n=1 Tax=Pengzhenrongella phosphoraccumulans TaxID=3114394 RepID=UPI00388F6BCB
MSALSPPRPRRAIGSSRTRRLGFAALAAAALVLVPAAAASAHVRVIPDATSSDGFAKVTFRVPNESATAGTVKVELAFPTDTPFISVTYLPVAGWTAEVVEADQPSPVEVAGATLTRAPSSVVWTADPGVQIAPGAFEEFSIVAGPLPDPGTEVELPATQTYSDGEVVAWDDLALVAEPELPAPVLIVPIGEEDAAAGDTATGDTATGDTAAGATASDPLARGLGGLGLLLGAGALVVVLARRSARTDRS